MLPVGVWNSTCRGEWSVNSPDSYREDIRERTGWRAGCDGHLDMVGEVVVLTLERGSGKS